MMSRDADVLHRRHMLAAIKAAREGMLSGKGGPFGALITDPAGRVVSVACNEVLASQDCTMHAEVAALRKVGHLDLRGHTLYATGFPCVMCLGAILWSRVSRSITATITPWPVRRVSMTRSSCARWERSLAAHLQWWKRSGCPGSISGGWPCRKARPCMRNGRA